MNKSGFRYTGILLIMLVHAMALQAQFADTERPKEWENLVGGGRFMDRFLPIPVIGPLTSKTWGGNNVLPRYIHNGIEDNEWSYWGGNILKGDNGLFHLYVCRWRENSPKGHMEWPNSIVVHATSQNSLGPFEVKETIGAGHNPEAFRLEDGRIVVYVIDGYYISDDVSGPWDFREFEFDNRDRPIIEGLSNLSFARREDGSFLMVCRGGGIWISKDGVAPYHQVTTSSVYPDVEGRFEDPVIWKTGVQYHLIVNDWYGRIAYYLRSKDGVKWVTDPGEAYMPGIAVYEDKTVEDWFKYERLKVLQDDQGRPVQANFAVIDTLKHEDKPNDRHSSKNLGIPLVKERMIQILNEKEFFNGTDPVQVLVLAEDDFNPATDINFESLRFGNPGKVSYGGGSRTIKTSRQGKNLIITFDGLEHGIGSEDFAAKLLGETTQGELFFAYSPIPGVNYREAILSARLPVLAENVSRQVLSVTVENFGQVISEKGELSVTLYFPDEKTEIHSAIIPKIKPYDKVILEIPVINNTHINDDVPVEVMVKTAGGIIENLSGKIRNSEDTAK